MTPNNVINLTGQKFNRLLVLEYIGKGYNNTGSRWKCRCDCGSEIIIPAVTFKNNGVKSCGCLNREKIAAKTLPLGEAAKRSLLLIYKASAKRRNLMFNLSVEDFTTLTNLPCHYCGIQPVSLHPNKIKVKAGGGTEFNGQYKFNGLDRKDNAIGYIQSNIVTCCTICNRAKHILSYVEFIAWMRRLVAHQTNVSQDVASNGGEMVSIG